jgi:hypothetical protein
MFQPTLELGTSLLNLKRDLSCHLMVFFYNQWIHLACFGGFYKVVGKDGEGHSGLWSQNSEIK